MHNDGILVKENALSFDEISQILNSGDLAFKKASVLSQGDSLGRLSNYRRVWTATFIDNDLTEKLNQLFKEASNIFNISFDSSLTELAIMRYKSDDYGHYGWHVDTIDDSEIKKNRKL